MPGISRRAVLKSGAFLALSPAVWTTGVLGAEPAAAKRKPDPYAGAVLVDGEPPAPAADSFTVVVLPDTQHYSEKHHEQYLAQTDWIVANRQARNIACVLHLGDITNHNTEAEWEVAAKAMCRLDGQVPYFMAVGNHDYLGEFRGHKDRLATRFNEYFPLGKYRGLPTFGGTYDREPDRLENSYHLFSAGGRNFLVIALEFGPRNDVVRWAGEVARKHQDREAILITHAYVYSDDTRYDWAKYGDRQQWNPHAYWLAKLSDEGVNDGEELWTKLVAPAGNFILTINGHVLHDGLGRLVTPTPSGRMVPQVLVNFQMKPQGGDGWLRLLEFHADRRTVDVFDYSPTRKQRNESPQNCFTLQTSPPAVS